MREYYLRSVTLDKKNRLIGWRQVGAGLATESEGVRGVAYEY